MLFSCTDVFAVKLGLQLTHVALTGNCALHSVLNEAIIEGEHSNIGGDEIDSSLCDWDWERKQQKDFVIFSLIVNKSESSLMKNPRPAGS